MILVKICGINSEAAFDAAVEAGADFLGFNFFPRSPRYVTATQAATLSARHEGGPKRVGLFVEPKAEDIATILDVFPLDILQIYGAVALCGELRARFSAATWRAVGIETEADLPIDTQNLDGFVIESKPPEHATRPGGNAKQMDWNILAGWQSPSPWLLAGGLTAGNVAEAIVTTNAPGVDVSSGVESLPGVKSPALIRRFVDIAKGVGASVGSK